MEIIAFFETYNGQTTGVKYGIAIGTSKNQKNTLFLHKGSLWLSKWDGHQMATIIHKRVKK